MEGEIGEGGREGRREGGGEKGEVGGRKGIGEGGGIGPNVCLFSFKHLLPHTLCVCMHD